MARLNIRANSAMPAAKRRRKESLPAVGLSSSESDSSSVSRSSPSSSSSSSSSPGSSSSSDDSSDDSSELSCDSSAESETPPPNVVCYTDANPPSGKHYWYWTQRHRYFSLYSSGIWMTDSSYFEVTPEPIAHAITTHVTKAFPSSSSSSSSSLTIVDAFCGVGGNSIQFALSPQVRLVIAIETDPSTIACARHNAQIYGVLEKIQFINGDFFELVEKRLRHEDVSAVFLSPPWGGPGYRSDEVFDLEEMKPYSASTIMAEARRVSDNIGLYIPRTSDLNQLAALAPEGETVQAVHCCLAGKSKAIMAYFGELNTSDR